jgi:hypothetical protein
MRGPQSLNPLHPLQWARWVLAAAMLAWLSGPAGGRPAERADAAEARAGRDRALAFLVDSQNPDGSFASGAIEGVHDTGYSVASFYDWQVATHALVVLALVECPETRARRAALDRAVRWFLTTRPPRRGSDWDNDTIWAALYGVVASVRLFQDSRFNASDSRDEIEARGLEFLALLTRNQVPTGGWGYYDDPPYSRRPKWGTSFATALVLPALSEAERLGWLTDPAVRRRAIAYVRRCALPNGAYEYDLNPIPRAPAGEHINQLKGSLSRIQVCNWALWRASDESVTLQDVRTGLERFFKHHRFLDIARMRPIPHEAYYANAGYFYYFGHYYAAMCIDELPAEDRPYFQDHLAHIILKLQERDGSWWDYPFYDYHRQYGTAMAVMTLHRCRRADEAAEK